jgi:hypothetical protein
VIIEFLHDEGGYLAWTEGHRNGYVLNCAPHPRADYLVLHRATCGTIAGKPSRGDTWTVTYQKVCSDSRDEIERWAAQIGPPTRCGICKPS